MVARTSLNDQPRRARRVPAVSLCAPPPDGEIGVKLAQLAFAPGTGPLTDKTAHRGEQVAVMNLFAGAFGAIKNPQSHRYVNLDDPAEASRAIYFASYLLSVIDARAFAMLA